MTATVQPPRVSGSVPGRFEDEVPNSESARGADPIQFRVVGTAAILCFFVLLIFSMREVEAVPTPSPLDVRTELTTPVPDPVPNTGTVTARRPCPEWHPRTRLVELGRSPERPWSAPFHVLPRSHPQSVGDGSIHQRRRRTSRTTDEFPEPERAIAGSLPRDLSSSVRN